MKASPFPEDGLLHRLLDDQQARFQRGEPLLVDSYLQQHPELRSRTEDLLTLIYNEIVLQEQRGEMPRLEEYAARFPELARELREQFEMHGLLGPPAPDAESGHGRQDSTVPPTRVSVSREVNADGEFSTVVPPQNPPPRDLRAMPELAGYEVLEVLGRGGMGVVYKARQLHPGRVVAVKMILGGAHAGTEHVVRFLSEAEAVGRLEHPNIVRLYECGKHQELPYFTLEYVTGGSLHSRIHGQPIPPQVAAQIVEQLARGMAVAHQQGIIHRDLKPANVMLAEDGTAKITDFGLARRVEGGGLTHSGDVLGTPSYMAPEQARGKTTAVGPAADIYALGAILYECLTGRPPFQGASVLDILPQVIGEEPVSPSRLVVGLPRDLETICLKCLQKDQRHRYLTATDLAEDLSRYQAGEPILARPVGSLERVMKWVKRRPLVAGLAVALVVSLLGGIIVSTIFGLHAEQKAYDERNARQEAERKTGEAVTARQAEEQQKIKAEAAATRAKLAEAEATAKAKSETLAKQAAEKARDDFADLLYVERIALSNREWFMGRIIASTKLLTECLPLRMGEDRRSWEWYYLRHRADSVLSPLPRSQFATCMASSCDSKLVSGSYDGTVTFWRTEKEKRELMPIVLGRLGGAVHCLAFSQEKPCRYLVAGSHTRYGEHNRAEVKVWDFTDVREPVRLPYPGANGASFNPVDDVQVALALEDGTVRIWDREAGKEIASLQLTEEGRAQGVSFSPDGKLLAAGGWGGVLSVWEVKTKKVVFSHKDAHSVWTNAVAFCPIPTGQLLLASAGRDRTVKLWNGKTGTLLRTLSHARAPTALAFHPTNPYLVTAGEDCAIHVWNLPETQEVATLRGHLTTVSNLAFTREGNHLWACDSSDGVRLWKWSELNQEAVIWRPHRSQCNAIAFSPDSRRLASVSTDFRTPEVRVWNPRRGEKLLVCKEIRGMPDSLAFSPDGKLLAAGSLSQPDDPENKGEIKIWDATTAAVVRTLPNDTGMSPHLAFSPDGLFLTWTNGAGHVHFWNLKDNREEAPLEAKGGTVSHPGFSRDGKYLAVVRRRQLVWSDVSEVLVWEVASRRLVRTYKSPSYGGKIAFHPDSQRIASISDDGVEKAEVRIWNVTTGIDERVLRGQMRSFDALAFTVDGKRLLTGGIDGTVKVWDLRTGQELLLLEHRGALSDLAVSRDGHLVAAVGGDYLEGAEIRVWDGTPKE
jgi:WD40 repeat protein